MLTNHRNPVPTIIQFHILSLWLILAMTAMTITIGCKSIEDKSPKSSSDLLVTFGEKHTLADFPSWIVLIKNAPPDAAPFMCSGVRIAPHFILTTASCLYPQAKLNPAELIHKPYRQHNITAIQYIASAPAAEATIVNLTPSQIYGVDIYHGIMKDPMINTLHLHSLALITTTDSTTGDDQFITIAPDHTQLSQLTGMQLYGFNHGFPVSDIDLDLKDNINQLLRSAGITLITDYFTNLYHRVIELKPNPNLNELSKQTEREYREQLANDFIYMNQLLDNDESGMFIIQTQAQHKLAPEPGVCSEDQGAPITHTPPNSLQPLLIGLVAHAQYNYEKSSLSPYMSDDDFISSLFNLFTCSQFSQAYFIPFYLDWITSTMAKRRNTIATDARQL